jgi:hypothetical protein
MALSTNGQLRKSLASQLDRLDGILDTISEGLNEAVATVVQEAVTAAVHAATLEVLTNPALQQRLRQTIKADKPANPIIQGVKRLCDWFTCGVGYIWSQVTSFTETVRGAIGSLTTAGRKNLVATVASGCRKVKAAIGRIWTSTLLALSFCVQSRTVLLLSLGAGVAVAIAAYWCGPIVSATISGFAGFLGSQVVSGIRAIRRAITGSVPQSA